MVSDSERAALQRTVVLARSPGVPAGPNPRVGCVLLAPDGTTIAEGFHRGAGTAHAEVDALRQAGLRARGATAVVSLEPCRHTGRTGPCSEALLEAGIARVVYAQADPHAVAAGGAERLRKAGVDVEGPVAVEGIDELTLGWSFAVTQGRPLVTWKVAATLDGRIAAPDRSSRWISGEGSRAQVHLLRQEVDAIMVGTGTALVDDPHLTARGPDGTTLAVQPLRVVVGRRPLPAAARLLDDQAPTLILATHEPRQVLHELADREIRHVLLEGGPTLAAAFLRAGLIDRVVWFAAPLLLGAGQAAVADMGAATLGQAVRLERVRVEQSGEDARIIGWVVR